MLKSTLLNDGSLLIATVRHQYQMTGSLWNEKDLHTQEKSPLDVRYKGTKIQQVWCKLECRNTLYYYFSDDTICYFFRKLNIKFCHI